MLHPHQLSLCTFAELSTLHAMKLLKPAWIPSEAGKPFFSLAIHPDGSRFATGGQGQGNDSGVVFIWNMAPVRSAQSERSRDVPKVLCKMTNHLGCVNCVRWSADGKWLASGGDDAIVMIWEIKYQGAAVSFGGGTTHEQWGCLHMLRGHSGDVLDVSWSPDLKYLASCSVDNMIVIWNANSLPQKFIVLEGHCGLVKGLTWDPVGKYLASQSDDRSVRIWRMSDWKEEKKVTEPFKHCGGTTHVLRLSWSPDGRYIISAHALNNDGPTAQIIERGGSWKTAMDFVGHRKAVEVVSFNPQLFVRKGCEDNHGCVAIGSRDRTLSIWLTTLKRPLVVTHDLFQDSILDISWSADGYELLVCSTDGTIAYLAFNEKELGVALPKQALCDLFQSIYGCKPITMSRSVTGGSILIEDPEVLAMQSTAKKSGDSSLLTSTPSKAIESAANVSLPLTSTSASQPTVQTQSETRTTDGRRRITPVMISSQPSSTSGAPLPFTSFSPKKDGVEMKRLSSGSISKSPGKLETLMSTDSPVAKKASDLAGITSPPPKPTSFAPLSPRKVPKQQPSSAAEESKSSLSLDKSSKGSHKRGPEGPLDTLLPKAKKLKRSSIVKVGESPTKLSTLGKASSSHTLVKRSQLSVPEVQASITLQLAASSTGKASWYLEVSNSSLLQSTLSARKGDETLWSTSLPTEALLLDGNQNIACVVTKDNALAVYSSLTGRLLLARVALPSPPHSIHTQAKFVMVVGSDANLSVWDTQSMKCLVRQAPFSHLTHGGKQPVSFCLTRSGAPVVSLGSASYVYHHDMAAWMEVYNSRETSEIDRAPFAFSSVEESAPLNHIQASSLCVADPISQRLGRMKGTQNTASTLTFLEAQVSRAQCLQSPLEFQHWCKEYVRYLVASEMEARLREFCNNFTGPSGKHELLLGFERSSLLKDFLLMIAGNTNLQRLYCELRDCTEGSSMV